MYDFVGERYVEKVVLETCVRHIVVASILTGVPYLSVVLTQQNAGIRGVAIGMILS